MESRVVRVGTEDGEREVFEISGIKYDNILLKSYLLDLTRTKGEREELLGGHYRISISLS